jgi:hypothetical protein
VNTATLELNGRSYGADLQAESAHSKYVQKPLQALTPLIEKLRSSSRLLQLTLDTTPDKRVILDAYTADLALLQTYQQQFELCMQLAIQCSLRMEGVNTKVAWAELQVEMPAIAKEPLIEYSFIRAAKPIETLLDELQAEVIISIDRLLLRMSWYLQMIAEAEFFGVIEWSAPDICRYNYFQHEITQKTSQSVPTQTRSYDETKELGQRNRVVTRWVETILHSRISERHVHHVVEARQYGLPEYPNMVPPNVATFLNGVPVWLRPLLQIVDGTITMEEKIRTRVDEHTQTHEKISISEYSPAVLIGDIALIGWSGVDLRNKGGQNYGYQASVTKSSRLFTRWGTTIGVLAFWVIAAIVGSMVYAFIIGRIATETKKRTAEYENYIVSHTTNVITTHRYNLLPIPGNNEWRFSGGGYDVRDGSIFFTKLAAEPQTGTDATLVGIGLPLVNPSRSGYGDVDLQPIVNIPATLHVLSANPTDIRYSVTFRGFRSTSR